MPIYEYTCKSCDVRFEKLQRSMNGRSAVACPECGSKQTERALSVFAVGAEQGPKSSSADASPCQRCNGNPEACAFR